MQSYFPVLRSAVNSERSASCAVMEGDVAWIMAALTDRGLAATLMTKLAETDPEKYGACAEELNAAANRELSRRKEEKTRAQKQRKPWVAPPKASSSPKAKKSNGGGLIEPD